MKLLAFAPVSLLLGIPLGVLKERIKKRSLKRWFLHLLPLALAPSLNVTAKDAVVLAGSFLFGRTLGASMVGVGLTGGIATGKTTVSNVFKSAGAVIVDADLVARDVVQPGRGAYKKIVRTFGEGVLNESDRTINRAKLGAIIFSDPKQRMILNACTHKYILWEMFKQMVYHRLVQRKRLVFFDAPLLFETGLLEYFSYPTIVVACSESTQIERLMNRDKLSKEDAEKRIRAQMKLSEKLKKADLVISNDGTVDELQQKAMQTLQLTAQLVGVAGELTNCN